MSNARAKGISYVREVKKLLESKGYRVEGPGYGCAFYGGSMRAVHRDFFGVFDLLSYRTYHMVGHQVTTLTNKAVKVKALKEANMCGYVWCRVKKGHYRVFFTDYIGKEHREEEMFMDNL